MTVSRICLGTAQLGMDYGINNATGRPSALESRAIIRLALASGVTTFDTAPSYGESERVLGECLGEAAKDSTIVSKVPGIDWTLGPSGVSAEIRRTVEATLSNLRIARLPVCLFHRFDDLFVHQKAALAELTGLGRAGLIGRIGASVYTPEEAEACLRLPECEVVQAPFNLADKRLLGIDFFRRAKAEGKAVFIRSVFLQGLFFKRELRAGLRFFASFREELESLAVGGGMSLAEMALRYALSVEGIDSIIVGVETADQLAANLAMAAGGPLPDPVLARIEELGTAPDRAIDPRLWPQDR